MALRGLNVVEFAGLAPGPMCGMILADFGAKVVRVDRIGALGLEQDSLSRGKYSLAVDLKKPEGHGIVRKLCKDADVVIEPFRKGVMEKLGLGPTTLMSENPALIYSRLTGYGQSGIMSERAGHDINFLSLSGVLSTLGRANEKPYAPINLIADFAGGSLVCALGIMMALHERHRSGRGQVIDASMVEGAAYLSTFLWTSRDVPFLWPEEPGGRGEGLLDGGAAVYDTYRTKDGKFVAVGALEPQFFDALLRVLELDPASLPDDGIFGEETKRLFADKFAEKTRDEWDALFDGVDACVTPVLDWSEAPAYRHNKERNSFRDDAVDGGVPLPAPKLERTPASPRDFGGVGQGQHTVEIVTGLGYAEEEIDQLLKNKVIRQGTEKLRL